MKGLCSGLQASLHQIVINVHIQPGFQVINKRLQYQQNLRSLHPQRKEEEAKVRREHEEQRNMVHRETYGKSTKPIASGNEAKRSKENRVPFRKGIKGEHEHIQLLKCPPQKNKQKQPKGGQSRESIVHKAQKTRQNSSKRNSSSHLIGLPIGLRHDSSTEYALFPALEACAIHRHRDVTQSPPFSPRASNGIPSNQQTSSLSLSPSTHPNPRDNRSNNQRKSI